MEKETLQIELVYDIICPWCYVGHHRLLNAIKKTNTKVSIKMLPFQLKPNIPVKGMPIKTYWQDKGVSDAESAYKNVIEAAESEGITINPAKFNKIPNTLKLHQVVLLAEEKGLGIDVLHAIQTAYFRDGVDLTKLKHLIEVTEDFLTVDELTKAWNNQDYYETLVLSKEEKVKSQKISVVPTYIVNSKERISGAISNYTIVDMLKKRALVDLENDFCAIDAVSC